MLILNYRCEFLATIFQIFDIRVILGYMPINRIRAEVSNNSNFLNYFSIICKIDFMGYIIFVFINVANMFLLSVCSIIIKVLNFEG